MDMPARAIPEVSGEDAEEAIDRIADRHMGDPTFERFGYAPLDAATYIVEHAPDSAIDLAAARADVEDGLALVAYERAQVARRLERLELQLLELGNRAGLSQDAMAPMVGVRDRRGVNELLRRARHAKAGGARTSRSIKRAAAARPVERQWFAEHGARLLTLARVLVSLPILPRSVEAEVSILAEELELVDSPTDVERMHDIAGILRVVFADFGEVRLPSLVELRELAAAHGKTLPTPD